MDDIKPSIHHGFNKQVWLNAYDEAALNFEWCQIMKKVTPADITPEQAIANIGFIEKEIDDRWPVVKGRVLELGADWGRLALYKVLRAEDLIYEACNTSNILTDHLKNISERLGISNRLHCHIMFAEDIQFPDETFDAVYALETLEHVGELDRSLKEIRRVLCPDGALIFSLPLLDYADGGFHTQKHSKDFWLSKFEQHGFDGDTYATRHPSGSHLPDGETGLVGCIKKTPT